MTALIEIHNLHYRPDSLPLERLDILDGISLEINRGEFVAIVGENGSGKTTLIKSINGLILPTQGNILVSGMDTRHPESRKTLRYMTGMVFQNPADQIVASTVEEDVAFGLENLNLPTSKIRASVKKQLDFLGLAAEGTRPPHLLSGGQIQKLALAGVLARQPEIILLDEPTSMLDPATRESFIGLLYKLNQQGLTTIYVTHHMEETVHADQVVILGHGKVLAKGTPGEIFANQAILYEAGLDLPLTTHISRQFRSLGWEIPDGILDPQDLFNRLPTYTGNRKPQTRTTKSNVSDALIRLEHVHYTYLAGSPLAKQALKGASLSVSANHIHGIAGANGSGKSTILQHINGILRPSQGSVSVNGTHLENPDTRLRDVIKKVGLVFQSPEAQFFEVFVGDEIAYGAKQFMMDNIRERVRKAMAMVGLDFEKYKDRRLETLSGGEKRKVALASTLILQQDILLFDEPTAGMDPRSRIELFNLFQSLNQQGKTIAIATHRLEELAMISDDVSLMQNGIVKYSGATKDIFSSLETFDDAGLSPPLAVRISQKLIELGWPIDHMNTITPEMLIQALKEVLS